MKVSLTAIAYTGKDALIAVGDWNTILRYQDDALWRYAPRSVEATGKRLTQWGRVKSRLYQNFPNPFNPETWMPYQLSTESEVTVLIYSVQGQRVRRLDIGRQAAGTHLTKEQAVYWDGRDDLGESVSSGVYFYTLQADDFRRTKRMVLLK